jgi:hypothetical protein
MAGDLTTIQIHKMTREELRVLGRKGETYDQVLKRLIELARKVGFFDDIDRILGTEEFVPLEEV